MQVCMLCISRMQAGAENKKREKGTGKGSRVEEGRRSEKEEEGGRRGNTYSDKWTTLTSLPLWTGLVGNLGLGRGNLRGFAVIAGLGHMPNIEWQINLSSSSL